VFNYIAYSVTLPVDNCVRLLFILLFGDEFGIKALDSRFYYLSAKIYFLLPLLGGDYSNNITGFPVDVVLQFCKFILRRLLSVCTTLT